MLVVLSIINALKNACANKGIDMNKMIEDMYNNAQSKLNQIAPIIEKFEDNFVLLFQIPKFV